MTMTPKSDTGSASYAKAEFMLIKLSYDCKLLLPIDEGNQLLAAYSKARQWEEPYQKPITIKPSPPEISVRYITAAELAKIKFDDMLGVTDDD